MVKGSRLTAPDSPAGGALAEGARPGQVHRMPRVHDGLQERERGSGRRDPDLRQVRRRRRVPAGPPRLPGDPVQPVRRRAVRECLPDPGDVPPRGRHRRFRQADLHRLQGVHGRVPLRRHLHQPRGPLGREVQHVRAPPRHRPGAGLRHRVPHRGDPGRRRQRPGLAGRPASSAREPVQVRRPEKETRPGVYYKGAHQATLDPLAARRPDGGLFAWATQGAPDPQLVVAGHPGRPASSAAALLSYDVPHHAPWGWRVSLYTWTKSIAAGVFVVPVLLALLGYLGWGDPVVRWAAPAVGAGLPRGHRRAADLGSQAPAALLPDLHPAPLAQLAGPRLLHHRRLRRRGWRCTSWPRSAAGPVPGRCWPGSALPLALATAVLHRVPVRPGQGPRPVAEPAAARRTSPSRRCWPARGDPPVRGLAVARPGGHRRRGDPGCRRRGPRAAGGRRDDAAACDRARPPGHRGDGARPVRLVLLARPGAAWPRPWPRRGSAWPPPRSRWPGCSPTSTPTCRPASPSRWPEERWQPCRSRRPRAMTWTPSGRGCPPRGRRPQARGETFYQGPSRVHLAAFPPKERWDDWAELDSRAWPAREERRYLLVPTTCFNCESACGLLAYVDRDSGQVRKFEGNPEHPGSRGPQLRQGPGHHQPGHRPRPHPVPAAPVRPARQRRLGADQLGRGARRARRPDPRRDHRGAAERDHDPHRPPRRGRLHRAGARQLGGGRAQLAHQRVLQRRPHRLPVLDGRRPAQPRPRQREGHLPDQRPPGSRALLQPARAADHRRPARTAPR